MHKKLILVAALRGLSDNKFLENVEAKVDAAIANPTIAPDLDPLPSAVKLRVTAIRGLFQTRKNKEDEIKALTEQIDLERTYLNNVIVDKWMPITQIAIVDDTEKAKTMSYTYRGATDPVAPEVTFLNSHPSIVDVVVSGNMMHTITAVNNITESWQLPEDVERCDIYETFDENNIRNLKKMIFLGSMKKGKFVNHFSEEDLHKDVWYVLVYIKKGSGASGELSGSIKSTVL